ncbi:MAG TPA: cytochrome P450 [Euzebyales bacterium]|nr:cytochrome P450 [Euzebyales bacterium]
MVPAARTPAGRRSAPRAVPAIGHLLQLRRDRLGFLTRVAREHGDLAELRLGPYRLLVASHPDLVRDVLVARPQAYRKGPIMQRARVVLGDGLLTSEGRDHRQQRHLLNRAFHPDRVAGYAQTMVAEAERSAERWRAGQPIDVHAEMVRATLTVAGRTLFATDVAADVSAIQAAVDDVLSAYGLAVLPAAWRLERLPVGPVRRLRRGRDTLDRIVRRMVAARRADGRDRGDLLSVLALADQGASMTDDQIRDHVVTLLLAGHETTANTLTFAWHLLAANPDMERRLHAEIDAVLAGRSATMADGDRLPCTRGVIAEALRLYPPSWAMTRQARAASELGGRQVVPGDVVVMSQWVVHRDPRWWPAPLRPEPERWTSDAVADRPRYAFFPFGAGVRQCIGESFARTEAVLALATLARRWRLRPVPGRPLRLAPVLTLRPRGGVWMYPEPR